MALAPRSALEVFHAPNNVCILQAIEVLYAECGSIQIDIPRKPFVDVQADYIVITPSFPAPPAPTNWDGPPPAGPPNGNQGPPNPGGYVPNTLVPVSWLLSAAMVSLSDSYNNRSSLPRVMTISTGRPDLPCLVPGSLVPITR